MAKQRPTPEELMARIKEEEQQQRGNLKIFLGAAPGVGKTYSMLEEARSKYKEGLDVIVGVVETHGRKEIEELLQDLEILPPQELVYRGKTLEEFDLDAALKRAPALILMDEMAHTNAPGLKHSKRWQDIREILDRGIDVYTTLNVQHIESLNDIVAQITGIHVRETVPDSVFESADAIELIDLPPDDLLKRLQEGKVYIPEQAELAIQHFFRKGNLIALRELALRVTAERVDAQVLSHRHSQGIQETWPTVERLLVYVNTEPGAAKIVRAARRMASRLQAEWIAVYVEAPQLRVPEEYRHRAIQNLRLAEQLGAEPIILIGLDIAKEIITFARERNVTKIVMGKPVHLRWRERIFGTLIDKLIRNSEEIDIYIIRGSSEGIKLPKPTTITRRPIPWLGYGVAIGITTFTTLLNLVLYPFLETSSLMMIYLLGVIGVSMQGIVGPAMLASLLSVVAYDFFFIPPRFSVMVDNIRSFIALMAMLCVAQVISHLTIRTRQQVEVAHLRERRIAVLNKLSRQLASSRGLGNILEPALKYISEVFDSEVMVLLPDGHETLILYAQYPAEQSLDVKEQSIARWVYDLGKTAGLGTEVLPFTKAVYLPLGSIGVLRVNPIDPERLLVPERLHFLEICASQIASALEADQLHEQTKTSEEETKPGVLGK